MSFLSILLYINPPEVLNFGGGHFDYLDDGKKEGTWDAAHQVARFTQQPISGGAVLFYHSIPHQGRMISVKGKQSPRYIARMDVFYKRTAPIFPKDLPGPYKGRVAPALPRNGGALVEKLLAGKSKGTEQPILLSGGSVGADTLAGAAALKAGHEVAHLYAACNEFWLSEDVRANQVARRHRHHHLHHLLHLHHHHLRRLLHHSPPRPARAHPGRQRLPAVRRAARLRPRDGRLREVRACAAR